MNLIKARLKQLSKTDKIVLDVVEETVAREDLIRWGQQPHENQLVKVTLPYDVKKVPFISLNSFIP